MRAANLAQVLSKILLVAGGFVFFFGDRALREIWNFGFASAELIGVGAGVLLMILGGILQTASKREIDRQKAARTPDADHTGRGSETW